MSATTLTFFKTPHSQSTITSTTIPISTSINPTSTTTTTSVSCPSSTSQALPITRNTYPLLMLTEPPFVDPTARVHVGHLHQAGGSGSPGLPHDQPTPPISAKSLYSSGRESTRRPKALHDIGSLPEGQLLMDLPPTVTHRGSSGSAGRPPPSPLNVMTSRQVCYIDSVQTYN